MLEVIKIYFLIGIMYTSVTWVITWIKARWFFDQLHFDNAIKHFAAVVLAFMLEIILWPRQIYISIREFMR